MGAELTHELCGVPIYHKQHRAEDRCQIGTERARLERMSKNHKDSEVVSEEKNRESEKEK